MPPKKAKRSASPSGENAKAPKKSKTSAARAIDQHCDLNGKVVDDWDAMLNQTNIANNNNKFYVIQLLESGGKFYVWNRWGRVGESGQNALKGPMSEDAAIKEFKSKFKAKTSNEWDNRSEFKAAAGKYTLIKLKDMSSPAPPTPEKEKKSGKPKKAGTTKSSLDPALVSLVRLIFREATASLTNSIDAVVTENGIETALGVLSVEQVAEGQEVLEEAVKIFHSKKKNKGELLKELSSKYYTLIPHRFGRNVPPILHNQVLLNKETELMELAMDMVNVTKKSKAVLKDVENIDEQYKSLGADISVVKSGSAEYKNVIGRIEESVESSHKDQKLVRVKNIFKVSRAEEQKRFTKKVPKPHQLLFHGSRINNWVGLLSRGIMMPKRVVEELGIARTDAGWLGSGVYFGNADTAAGYAGASSTSKTKFMLGCTVALGKMKKYEKITYGLSSAGKGFHSSHGVAGTAFYDDEYVVYDESQFKTDYLIELHQ